MEITKDINRKRKYDEEINEIENLCTKAKEITKKEYEEKPCLHDIVVKFYGTLYSYNYDKPIYICLGCHEDLTSKGKEIENDPNKYIIDFTSQYWYDVSKKHTNYELINYLRNLAIECENKLPGYSDADFVDMVNDNISYIMKNNVFR